MIRVESLSKCYGSLWALRDVSFEAAPGEILLLLGSNGAGKTTLVRALLGTTSFRGSIRVDGLDPLTQGKAVRRRIGYMPQSKGLQPNLTVSETLSFYSALRKIDPVRGEEALESVELEDCNDTKVRELSGGMRQRLGFALAVMSDPPILVLDEPTASLDRKSREALVDQLYRAAAAGKTVLLSTHAEHELARTAHRSLSLEQGRLVA